MVDQDETGNKSGVASVRVRMYRPGLGDCFLITFQTEEKDVHMLIDCGVFLGTSGGADQIRRIARDLAAQTNQHLDVTVATHEHWDHLAGFIYAQEVFDELEISQVWLAWTEDPANPLARQLRAEQEAHLNALHLALQNIKDQLGDYGSGIQELLNFSGEALAASGGRSTRAALEYLAKHKSARIKYCYPGRKPLILDDLPGVRIYVLGPPEDETLIKHSEPGASGDEVYHELTRLNLSNSFFAALPLGAERDQYSAIRDLSFPFDGQYRISLEDARQNAFFGEYYGFDEEKKSENAWRRIDTDWLDLVGELALALDNDTNNTSLVLAIELVESGKVLLFPADAQVGNWQSWQLLEWEVDSGNGQTKKIRARDLLERAVLYKVGHHGSHNATLRELGLEMMTSDELVAMIPVDQEFAGKKKWSMPFDPLLRRLKEKTRGRVIRSDLGIPDEQELLLSPAERATFRNTTRETDLFIDYIISGRAP